MLVGVFVGALIGPALLVMDHDRPYRGVIVMVISALMVVIAAANDRQSTP